MRQTSAFALSATLGLFALAAAGPAEAGASRQSGATGLNKCGTLDRPGAYVVTRDLSTVGDCLVITADFVSLDLADHVISGDGTGAGITDSGSPRLSIAVTGGTITNFAVAVDLGTSAPISATNLRIIANSGAIDVLQCSADPEIVGRPSGIITGSNSLVLDNQLRDNVGLAIKVGSGSIAADNSVRGGQSAVDGREVSGICAFSGSRVTGNALIDNGALAVQANSGSTVAGNTARNNGDGLRTNVGSTISGNTAHANNGFGIETACPSNILGNTAVDNGAGNIVPQGDGCNLVDNLAP